MPATPRMQSISRVSPPTRGKQVPPLTPRGAPTPAAWLVRLRLRPPLRPPSPMPKRMRPRRTVALRPRQQVASMPA